MKDIISIIQVFPSLGQPPVKYFTRDSPVEFLTDTWWTILELFFDHDVQHHLCNLRGTIMKYFTGEIPCKMFHMEGLTLLRGGKGEKVQGGNKGKGGVVEGLGGGRE